MKIEIVKHFNGSWGIDQLIKRLRLVGMLKSDFTRPYSDAYISLEKINVDCLAPPQNYVLNYELAGKLDLKYALEEHNIDMYNLNGFVEFSVNGDLDENGDKIIRTLLPPIVEESIEEDGTILPVINDGMHRCYLARTERRKIEVAYIRGVPKHLPYYAYPIRGGWDSVERIDSLEKGYIKKWHRIKENKQLYRNFDSAFKTCSKPRGSK